ncbi:HAD family hydrolase, partial [Streptomyces sp. NPDC006324]
MTVHGDRGRQGGGRTRPGNSAEPLSGAYDTALLDLDGVVYAGGLAVPHAVESLGTARDGGMRLAYVTNNALRTPEAVAEHLTELGVPVATWPLTRTWRPWTGQLRRRRPAGRMRPAAGG